KLSSLVQEGSAPLEVVAFFSELLDPSINRHDPAHLVADVLRVFIRKQEITVGHGMAANNGGDLPLRKRMANLMSGNLGAETDSSFRVGVRTSAPLLVTGLARQDKPPLLPLPGHGNDEDDI